MKLISQFAAIIFFVVTNHSVAIAESNCETMKDASTAQTIDAEISSHAAFIIYSQRDDSILANMTPKGQEEFADSLVFTERGLGSYSYLPLVRELSEQQINELMELFGFVGVGTYLFNHVEVLRSDEPVPPTVGAHGYYCADRGTCREEQGAICTMSC